MRNRSLPARLFIISSLSAILALSCSFAQGSDAADKAAQQFHSQFQAEEWLVIYNASDPQFQKATSVPDWTAFMGAVRRKLGSYRSAQRTLVNIFSGNDGTTVTQTFDTEFEQGRATEQFRWRIVGDCAVLLGYNISSPLLIIR